MILIHLMHIFYNFMQKYAILMIYDETLMQCYGICMLCYEKLKQRLNDMLCYVMLWYAMKSDKHASVYKKSLNHFSVK